MSFASIIYGAYLVFEKLIFDIDLPGWPTLVAGICFLSGIQLMSIGILGEYIGRTFVEVKQRSPYVIGHYHESELLTQEAQSDD